MKNGGCRLERVAGTMPPEFSPETATCTLARRCSRSSWILCRGRLRYRYFLEKGDREDLQQCVERGVQVEALLDDGDEDVDRDGDPDLGLHRVFGCPEEPFDPEMLLDPLEEQLDLPAAFVERADGRGRQAKLVGEEHQRLARLGVPEADAPQMFGVMPAGIVTIESNGLIADDPNGTVARGGIDPVGIHVRFGTGDKEGAGQMQPMEPDEIDIAAIHHVDGARFREQQIERVDIVQLAVRDMDEARDVAAQIQ